MYGPGPGETELSWPPVSLGPRANYHNLWEAIENVAHLILYKLYYTSNHQNIDFVVIAINLHVLPEMPSRNLLFRICSLVTERRRPQPQPRPRHCPRVVRCLGVSGAK